MAVVVVVAMKRQGTQSSKSVENATVKMRTADPKWDRTLRERGPSHNKTLIPKSHSQATRTAREPIQAKPVAATEPCETKAKAEKQRTASGSDSCEPTVVTKSVE